MVHETFIIWSITFGIIYGTIGLAFHIKSKSALILKRTPLFVLISQFGALIQCIIVLSQMLVRDEEFQEQALKHNGLVLRLRQSGLLLAHYILFTPYLIRCYRMYFVFSLNANWDIHDSFFASHKHRVERKWLLKILALLSIPTIIPVIIVLTDRAASCYIPGSELATNSAQRNLSQCVYVFLCFVEQISLLFGGFLIRNIRDDYKVTSELFFIMIAWVITPIFPIINSHDTNLLIPILVRNILLLLVSCVYPIILTFFTPINFEVVTLEMISSLDLVLQSENPLEYFEEFLVSFSTQINEKESKKSGAALLELYMKCETYSVQQDLHDGNEILMTLANYFPGYSSDASVDSIAKSKKIIFDILNKEYFCNFLESKYYESLKRQITKQEIYLGRILQTSLECNKYIATIVSRRKSTYQIRKLF